MSPGDKKQHFYFAGILLTIFLALRFDKARGHVGKKQPFQQGESEVENEDVFQLSH